MTKEQLQKKLDQETASADYMRDQKRNAELKLATLESKFKQVENENFEMKQTIKTFVQVLIESRGCLTTSRFTDEKKTVEIPYHPPFTMNYPSNAEQIRHDPPYGMRSQISSRIEYCLMILQRYINGN